MSATMTASKEVKRTPVPMNGVDTPTLLAKINAVARPAGTRQAIRRLNALLGAHSRCDVAELAGAAHFMIATHASDLADAGGQAHRPCRSSG